MVGLCFIIFIIGIAFNTINIIFNIFSFYIINIFIFIVINNIVLSYDYMYTKRLRAIFVDRALYKYFYYYY